MNVFVEAEGNRLKITSEDPHFAENAIDWVADNFLLNMEKAVTHIGYLQQLNYTIQITQDAIELIKKISSEDYVLPSSMKDIELKSFQKRGMNFAKDKDAVLFNYSPGTGKTVIGIAIANEHIDEVDHIVVFLPCNLILNWELRFKKFSDIYVESVRPSLSIKKRQDFYEKSQAKIWILNYEKLRTADYDIILKKLQGKKCVFIYDEFQKLRNRKSSLSKAFKKLVTKIKPKQYALTATPVENKPDDLYNLFRILEPTRFGNVSDFEHDFTYMDGAIDEYGRYIGYKNIAGMRARVADLVHSIDKNDPDIASEFPEREEILIELELSKEDRKLYDAVKKVANDTLQEVKDNIASRTMESYEERVILGMTFNTLRGICQMPYAQGESLKRSKHWYAKRLAECFKDVKPRTTVKIEETQRIINNIQEQGDKALLFCQFTHNCLLPLAQYLEKFDPMIYYGEMTNKEKEATELEFQSNNSKKLLMLSDAGREGLNFPQGSYVINYDTPTLYTRLVQRSERVSRIDSEKKVTFSIRFMYINTVEEKIEQSMQERRQMSASMSLGGEFEDASEVYSVDELRWFVTD